MNDYLNHMDIWFYGLFTFVVTTLHCVGIVAFLAKLAILIVTGG